MIFIYKVVLFCYYFFMKKIRMKRVNYHLSEKTIAILKTTSNMTGISVAELIRRAIDSYLTQKDIPLIRD